MSVPENLDGFERQLRERLERHADAVSGRVRSRLTQARHAALARAGERRTLPGGRMWLPVAGALAAAVMWVMLSGPPHAAPPPPFAGGTGVVTDQDVTLLTDRDGLALVEGGGGQFYEWAVTQTPGAAASGVADDEPEKNGG